jgi:hypothetical protein
MRRDMAMETSQICRRFGVIFQEYVAPSESNHIKSMVNVLSGFHIFVVKPISHGFQ